MMFLATVNSADDVAQYVQAEIAHVAELERQGVVTQVLLTPDKKQAFLLLAVEDHRAAQDVLAGLPMVALGGSTFSLVEVVPSPAAPA